MEVGSLKLKVQPSTIKQEKTWIGVFVEKEFAEHCLFGYYYGKFFYGN